MELVRKHLIDRKRRLALISILVCATAALWGAAASAQVVTIEENTLGFCAVEGTVDSNHSGFTGSGFANADNATGSGVNWSVNVPASGSYQLEWRFANASSDRPGSVRINGANVATVGFPSTGAWTSWTTVSTMVSLNAGRNSIRLEATTSAGLANIDSLAVTGGSAVQAAACDGGTAEILIEENTTGFCRVEGSIATNHAGYTGGGFADTNNATGAGVDWKVSVPSGGNYVLAWRYANGSTTNRPGSVQVNGASVATVDFPATGAWTTWAVVSSANIALSAGENTIRLQATTSAGLGNIDSLSVTGNSPQPVDCRNNSGGYPRGNPPVPSAGCGKSPGLQSGTHRMTSAGLNREFIVSLPNTYDANKPHRLVFGMHWMNGSAEAVAGWSRWFGLKALDTQQNTIFVAPQGYTNGSPWRGGDNRDHIFFDELNTHLASNLCVDKSRVFSVGFSFGAMYTNALAQTHQDMLRGVVVYATADYNIYFPENTGKPLAFMAVHGKDDPTCPISSGRRSRDRFVANNACAIPGSVPEARDGGSQVTFDYTCPDNYPVRWTTFDGGHTYPPNNTPIGSSWVHPLTWEFITQF
jgi:poly(3-hydroxybutyrate) depolymerase